MDSASERLAVLQRQLTRASGDTALQAWFCHDNQQLREDMLEFLKVWTLNAWQFSMKLHKLVVRA